MLKIQTTTLEVTACKILLSWPNKEGGTKNKKKLVYKKLYIYSYIFKLQSLSEYTLSDAIHL